MVVVVSAPHRGDAFDAARFGIDTLKETVPIWKQEHWSGGSDWAVEQHRSDRWRADGSSDAERIMAFLLFALVVSAVGITVVLLRNRRPTSIEHSIDEFERGLRALAPKRRRRRRPSRRSE